MSGPDDFYDDPIHVTEDDSRGFGPVFAAEYVTDSACCGDRIEPGEDARADGQGGWIHADDACEAIASRHGSMPERADPVPMRSDDRAAGRLCPSCSCFHAGECL